MVTVHFATNRNTSRREGEYFGERFHADGPQFYRVGTAEVALVDPADPDDGYQVQQVEVTPERAPNLATGRTARLGSSTMFEGLRAAIAAEPRDVLVFIHGFANTFSSSIARAAQLKEAYLIDPGNGGAPYQPHVVAFSWPTNGRTQPPWEYHSDRDDAVGSGQAMARFFLRFWAFLTDPAGGEPCRQRLHLVAHSMGNWALRNMLLNLNRLVDDFPVVGTSRGRLPTVFENAFLMAADEDDNALESPAKLGLLFQFARHIHVYHSADDRALVVSDVTKNNPDRLGSDGPRTFSGLSPRLTAIDCSSVDETRLSHGNHQYYRLRPEVIADVRAVLAGRLRPDEIPGRVTVEPARRYRISG